LLAGAALHEPAHHFGDVPRGDVDGFGGHDQVADDQPERRLADPPDLPGALGRATKDGAATGEGHGRDILGHPFNSAAWLATQLASRGEGLKAGQVVMTGAVMKTVFPEDAAGYRFDLAGIGSVEVQVR